MRVYLQYEFNLTGKGLFLSRLSPELKKLGVDIITDSPKGCDVTLGLTHWRKESGKLPRVLRLDGVHMVASKKIGWRNGQISEAIAKADVAIWQSKFCKSIVGGMLGKPKKNYVIFNGANPADYDKIEPTKSPYPKNIILLAKWVSSDGTPRFSKRLKDSVKIAQKYTEKCKDICFWILGNVDKKRYECDQIRYLGWLENDKTMPYLKMADAFLCLPYFDWCPNSVVEMLSAGVYGIVSNNGGQAEMVGKYGTILDLDKPMKAKMLTMSEVPPIDYDAVMAAIDYFYSQRPPITINPDVHISAVARRYKEALEAAL